MLWRVHLVLKRAYVLMARRVTDVGSPQRASTHDHGSAQLARSGGLEAYRCASRRSVGGEVPEGHCSSELGRVCLFVGRFVSFRSLLCVVNYGYASNPRMIEKIQLLKWT